MNPSLGLKFGWKDFRFRRIIRMKSGIVENNRRATLLSSSFLRKKNCSIYFSYSSYVNPSREGSWAILCHWRIFPEYGNRTSNAIIEQFHLEKHFPTYFLVVLVTGKICHLGTLFFITSPPPRSRFSSFLKSSFQWRNVHIFFNYYRIERNSIFLQFFFDRTLSKRFFFSKRFKAAIFQFPSRYFFQRVERKEKEKTRIVSIVIIHSPRNWKSLNFSPEQLNESF